ncbi:MAG: cob(I)yrinic acid a,c-diamide adenosyltransferase [Candidatus Paracaedibacteraceae bacterium]|nr:cob(I)yrinic acid a,c-diamide adenosyltransferase [Candidatus Paracaedibacteraceae bacterium]
MVQLTRIYTRGGDKGKTSLGDGTRVLKSNLRMDAIGAVDEANSSIGIASVQADDVLAKILYRIQNDLFDVGADLCLPDLTQPALRIAETQVLWLENQIDYFNESLSPLTSFILPGGTILAASLHLSRTIVRRSERVIVALSQETQLNLEVVKYMNRLSDLLFVLSRVANNNGQDDVLWVPGANR